MQLSNLEVLMVLGHVSRGGQTQNKICFMVHVWTSAPLTINCKPINSILHKTATIMAHK